MKTLNNVKVFGFNNPNLKIKNNREEILEMLNKGNIPIVDKLTDIDGDVIPRELQKPIGVVKPNTAIMIGDEIFADIEVIDNVIGEYVNYEVYVENDYITKFASIEIR